MNFVRKYSLVIITITFLCCDIVNTFEPITTGIALSTVGAGLIGYFRKPLKKYTICKIYECCDENSIKADFNKLKYELEEKLYGQHLALDIVVNALSAHWKEKQPQKPLTMSFHGWPGSGKNYVTTFIKRALYRKGSKSQYIQHFVGRIHFPIAEKADTYKENLQNWIKNNVSECGHSLFIFDEVDKMPPGVLNAIKPIIDYNDNVDRVDYRNAIFIFLSNTGSTIIKDHLLYLWKWGTLRKDIQLHDFEHLILRGAFNEEGGLQHSDAIKSNLIDHYIPFFPMEKEHVELCIKDQFAIRGMNNPDKKLIDEVMSYVEWGPPPENLYSTTGCKRLSQKVALVLQKYRLSVTNIRDEF